MLKNKLSFSVITMSVLTMLGTTLFSGCSTYMESQQINKIEDNKIPQGVIYALPMLQYEVEITRRLISCQPEINIQVSTEVKESLISDPNAIFELDYQELAGIFSTSEFVAELYENGALKSVNVEADDRSAEILANTFKIVSNVALAAAKVPSSAPSTTDDSDKKLLCKTNVIDTLKALRDTEKDLIRVTGEVNRATEKVKNLNLIVAAADKPSEDLLKSLQDALQVLKLSNNKLETLNKARAPFLAIVMHKETKRWPESTSGQVNSATFAPPEQLKTLWFDITKGVEELEEYRNINKKLALYFNIEQLIAKVPIHAPTTVKKGIFYRYPMPAELKICTIAACDQQKKSLIKKIRSNVPQYGPLVLLPFENKMFQNNRLEVTFNDTGLPSKVSYKVQKAAAEVATGAIAGIAEQLPALQQQLLSAELEELKRETALLTQEKALQDAAAALEPTTPQAPSLISEIEAETAIINAKIALINAQTALEEIQNNQP